MALRPIEFRAAQAFVARLHRHNKPPRGHKFSVSVVKDDAVVGVAMAGRPIARAFQDGLTLEINRTCTDGAENANSMLYGACRRAAWAMGYRRIITYTRVDESGTSLRAAGFVKVKELAPRPGWDNLSRRMADMFDDGSNDNIGRVLWEIRR